MTRKINKNIALKKINQTTTDRTRIRHDGWNNIYTGMGYANRDKKTGSNILHTILSQEDVEALYDGDANAAKIVAKIPQEGLREGFRFTKLTEEQKIDIQKDLERLKISEKLELAWIYSRLYGDGMILMSVADGLSLKDPLDINKITKLNALTVMHRYMLNPLTDILDTDISSENFGLPIYFTLNLSGNHTENLEPIHYSRFLRIVGTPLSPGNFKLNNYWNDSVLSKIVDELEGFATTHNSLSKLIEEYKIGILTIEDLADDLAAEDGEEKIIKRLTTFDMGKSLMKTACIDKSEKYELIVPSLTAVSDVVSKVEQRLVAVSGYPHTIMLGDSPTGGLNGAGDSENRNFYDEVAAQQKRKLRPVLTPLLNILRPKLDTSYVFNALWQLDDVEAAKVKESIAKADDYYINNGSLTPEEVALSRFGGETFGYDIKLNDELRKKNVNPNVNEG